MSKVLKRRLFFAFYILFVGFLPTLMLIDQNTNYSNGAEHSGYIMILVIILYCIQLDILFIYIPVFRNILRDSKAGSFNTLWFTLLIFLVSEPIYRLYEFIESNPSINITIAIYGILPILKILFILACIIHYLKIYKNKRDKLYFSLYDLEESD